MKGFLITLAVVIGLIVAFFIFYYAPANAARSEAKHQENGLVAQIQVEQTYYTNYVNGFVEQFQLQQFAGDQLNEILIGALQGRYGEDGFSSDGAFFSAIAEAYPDLSELVNKVGDIQSYVRSKRAGYTSLVEKRLDMARAYRDTLEAEDWIKTQAYSGGFIFGEPFPSRSLQFRVGNEIFYGQDALDRMILGISSEATENTYEDMSEEPITLPLNDE